MPAATTHVEFAKDVYQSSEFLKENVKNKQLFWLGSQGPDVLFFSRMSILPGSLRKYGNMMHEKKVSEVITFFDSYVKEVPELKSYFYGYLCHYALDSHVHPLVYGVTHDQYLKHGGKEGLIHVDVESEIDVWVLNHKGKNIEDYDVFHYLYVEKRDAELLAKMYHEMFKAVFDLDVATKTICSAITEIHTYTKLLYPKKTTYHLFYGIESLMNNHFVTAMMLYGKKVGPIINLDHKTYSLPWNKDETISASFPELYDEALKYAQEIVKAPMNFSYTKTFDGQLVN